MAVEFAYRDNVLHCEDVSLDAIVAAHGTPVYVYSEGAIRTRYMELDNAFSGVDKLIAYSVKANGNIAVLRLLASLGAGADIVSGGELARALTAGIPAERIVFSGVGKTLVEMAAALDARIRCFNVESGGELDELARLAKTMGTVAPIALRVNPDIESPTPHHYTRTGHRTSKFGIPIDEAVGLYRAAAKNPALRIVGIDVHIGSQILEVGPYRQAMAQVLEVVDLLRADGIEFDHVDIGGGYGIAYDGDVGPDAGTFAEGLLPMLRDRNLKLVLEPGRYIVGPAGVMLTRVLYIKDMGEKAYVISDAGMNDLLRPSHYASYHRVEPVAKYGGRDIRRYDIVGPICESGDFLALDRPLVEPRPGELLCIRTTGAYGFAMASTYNARPRPPEVMVSGNEFRLIRRREGIDDLMRGELELFQPQPQPQPSVFK